VLNISTGYILKLRQSK